MKTYQITIEPLAPFGTPLKGDTLFGQFCWQAVYDQTLLACSLDEALSRYAEKPFAVFSSAFPVLTKGGFALKRPDLPLEQLFNFDGMSHAEIVVERKKLRKRKWLLCERTGVLSNLKQFQYVDDEELAVLAISEEDTPAINGKLSGIVKNVLDSHNSINRLTGTTGEGFDPFSQIVTTWHPHVRLALFVGIDETLVKVDALVKGLACIGTLGFGRDTSTGLGKFRVLNCVPFDLSQVGASSPNAFYTLAPSVPEKGAYAKAFFTPFTRFGRHGDRLAKSGNPFKNPVIMADEGAVLVPSDIKSALGRPYLGRGVSEVSMAQYGAVAQGYSLYIPIRLEV